MSATLGPYRLLQEIGRGGMGVVYQAEDPRLGRRIALKTVRDAGDSSARIRLLREARAAASVNHPNICQIYDVGEEGGEVFIAMELLEGTPLSTRLEDGPLPPRDAIDCALGVLAALGALHARGVIHRDVKPSNVFLGRHGTKLLDFGLAREDAGDFLNAAGDLTRPGTIVGTPRYIAPERWAGEAAGPASDLFAVGALLFEMLSGQPAFPGRTIIEIYEAIARQQPPALTGGPAVLAADRVIQRALEKSPADRHPSADVMAEDLRRALAHDDVPEPAKVRRVSRLLILPLRLLRSDPDTDFLATSLPEAIAGSLAGLDSLVVRFASQPLPDPSHADADLLLSGTLLRAGERVRVTAQLTETPGGAIAGSATVESPLSDLFQLQDTLTHRLVDSLAVPLSARERSRLDRDVPATAKAYELYLRASSIEVRWTQAKPIQDAIELYEACLREDPDYAPAWAALGRLCRVTAKYGLADPPGHQRRAEAAFRRAFALNPDLSSAHHYYTHLEIEEGRPLDAMVRLIERAHTRATDPELFVGLVAAGRICGLLDAALAADRRAKRLDPSLRTSVAYVHWMKGDYARASAADRDDPPFLRSLAPAYLGREAESIELFRQQVERRIEGAEGDSLEFTLAVLTGDKESVRHGAPLYIANSFRDPEAIYLLSACFAKAGEREEALRQLTRAVELGFGCHDRLLEDPWLASLHDDPAFPRIVDRARSLHLRAVAEYERVGGQRLLGVGA